MFDADGLLKRLLGSGAATGFAGGLLGGGVAGLLGSKRGRKLAASGLKIGGIAAVGALAYHAYTRYQAGQAAAPAPSPASAGLPPPPPGSGFLPNPADAAALHSVGVVLMRAMIAAAKADGEVDAAENRRVFARLAELDMDAEERSFLLGEFSRPADIDALVRAATTPQMAAEIYTASLMAIEVSHPAESAYLQLLASRLGLAPGLVTELHDAVDRSVKPA
jgi:uncharacterized membrane protein YebE (DUF533 family)